MSSATVTAPEKPGHCHYYQHGQCTNKAKCPHGSMRDGKQTCSTNGILSCDFIGFRDGRR